MITSAVTSLLCGKFTPFILRMWLGTINPPDASRRLVPIIKSNHFPRSEKDLRNADAENTERSPVQLWKRFSLMHLSDAPPLNTSRHRLLSASRRGPFIRSCIHQPFPSPLMKRTWARLQVCRGLWTENRRRWPFPSVKCMF